MKIILPFTVRACKNCQLYVKIEPIIYVLVMADICNSLRQAIIFCPMISSSFFLPSSSSSSFSSPNLSGCQSTRHMTNSSHCQIVTRSTRNSQLVTIRQTHINTIHYFCVYSLSSISCACNVYYCSVMRFFIMAAVRTRSGHYVFALWFLLLLLRFSSP